jgi:hypothetical protein
MKTFKSISIIILLIIIFSINTNLFSQKMDVIGSPRIARVLISPKFGIIPSDEIINEINSTKYIGLNIAFPFESLLIGFQFTHHYVEYDYSRTPILTEGLVYKNDKFRYELLVSLQKRIKFNSFYSGILSGVGLSTLRIGGPGYYNRQSIFIPISFELGKEVSKLVNIAFEIEKKIYNSKDKNNTLMIGIKCEFQIL